MDAVVLDWTISLADKDRMKTCAVTYLSTEHPEKANTIDPFMPQSRTFLLQDLTPNQVSTNHHVHLTASTYDVVVLDIYPCHLQKSLESFLLAVTFCFSKAYLFAFELSIRIHRALNTNAFFVPTFMQPMFSAV